MPKSTPNERGPIDDWRYITSGLAGVFVPLLLALLYLLVTTENLFN